MVIFVLLEIIAFNWLISTHTIFGDRASGVGLRYSNTWLDAVGRIETFKSIEGHNYKLIIENSRLRTENNNLRALTDSTEISNMGLDSIHGNWMSIPAEIVYSTTHMKTNKLIANKGTDHGVEIGAGVLFNGVVAGRVIEVSETKSLIFPLTHTDTEWNVRVGEEGSVGRLVWDGKDLNIGTVKDIVKSTLVLPDEMIITTGFQGIFPAGLPIGSVLSVETNNAKEFQTLFIDFGANFTSIRYVEIIQNNDKSSIDSLIN